MTTKLIEDGSWAKIDIFRNQTNESRFTKIIGSWLLTISTVRETVDSIISTQDIDPRWSQTVALNLLRLPNEDLQEQYELTKDATLALDPILKNTVPQIIIHLTKTLNVA